jgi:hypothetical protein
MKSQSLLTAAFGCTEAMTYITNTFSQTSMAVALETIFGLQPSFQPARFLRITGRPMDCKSK